MRGLLLDPKTGRPAEHDWMTDAVEEGRLPASVLRYRDLARERPRGSGPTATKQGFNEVLKVDVADGTQVAATTTETILTPDYVFAAGDPRIYQGAVFRYTLFGDVSFVITTPGTVTYRLRWGGVGGTAMATSGAYAPDPTAAQANRSYFLQFYFTVRSIGTAGSIFTMGQLQINDVDDASATTIQGNLNSGIIPTSAPAVVGSLDTTTSKNLSATVQFSVATAGTQATNHMAILECLN